MNTNQKSMRYDQNDYDALLHSKIPAALVETPQMNFDDASDASVFFARELDYVKSQSYDVEYPEFTALKLFPVSSEINPGAETVTYYSYDKTGTMKKILLWLFPSVGIYTGPWTHGIITREENENETAQMS